MIRFFIFFLLIVSCQSSPYSPMDVSKNIDCELLFRRYESICGVLYELSETVPEDKIGLQIIKTQFDSMKPEQSLLDLSNEIYLVVFQIERLAKARYNK